MSIIEIPNNNGILKWLKKTFLIEKLNNPTGYVIGIGLALVLAFVLSALPFTLGAMLVGAVLGLPVVLLCFVNLRIGIIIMLCTGYILPWMGKYVNAPIGMAVDGLLVLLLFGLLVRLVKERDFSFAKSPITVLILIWIYYNFTLVLNPWAGSRMAWVYTVRTVALYLSVYFVAAHCLSSLNSIKSVFKTIIILSTLAALYSLKQEFIGYSDAEMRWLHSDPKRYELIFQWSRLRVFSFFSDPTTFGILMSYVFVFCLVLILRIQKNWQKIVLSICSLMMLLGMSYAGSRTPFVLLPAGVMFYMLMTFSRNTIIAAGVMVLFVTAFAMKSTSNPVIFRIQSAFKPTEDASVQVRMDNQAKVQPLVQSRPIGSGLGSTGAWGKRFTPNTWLASFAHDSLYVRIAVEAGWIGLILYMLLTFYALKEAIYYYFRCRNPEIKTYYLATLMVVFILALANYPQEAVTLPPNNMIFYVFLAIIVRLKDFDPAFQKEPEKTLGMANK